MSDSETHTVGYADVVAGVRAAISAYAQALDDGRTNDVVALFCDDAVCDIPGAGVLTGREQIHAAFSQWTPRRPQRHLVFNTVVSNWNDTSAEASSDLVFLLLGKAGWSINMVGRYDDRLRCENGSWRFSSRVATFITSDPPV